MAGTTHPTRNFRPPMDILIVKAKVVSSLDRMVGWDRMTKFNQYRGLVRLGAEDDSHSLIFGNRHNAPVLIWLFTILENDK